MPAIASHPRVHRESGFQEQRGRWSSDAHRDTPHIEVHGVLSERFGVSGVREALLRPKYWTH